MPFARSCACVVEGMKISTARRFEPLRAEPNGFRVHLLDRSDTLSWSEGHGSTYARCMAAPNALGVPRVACPFAQRAMVLEKCFRWCCPGLVSTIVS